MLPVAGTRPDLRSLSLDELALLVSGMGAEPYRARQLFRWLHQRGASSIEEMTDLPRAFRQRLADETRLATLSIDAVQQSSDGTRKYRLRTEDGKFIEAVYMPEESDDTEEEPAAGRGGSGDEHLRLRRTLCGSTQGGGAMGCGFCMTATMGLLRNLTAGEIADQVYRVNADLREVPGVDRQRPLTNLVYMGMGEPLHNYVNVKRSLDLLLHPEGANFSHRHVTVSTSGLVPNIQRLGEETRVKLVVSVTATTDEQRARLMPVD